jgi:two-component system, NtrC family, sensor kinase
MQTIFVCDDEPEILRYLDKMLQASGYRVETFPRGTGLLMRLESAVVMPCDVILQDVRMPDLSEVETIIRQVGRVERIVSNLLTFARTKKKVIRPFRIEAILDDILDQIGHQIPLDTYRIERRYQAAGVDIEGDEDQLRQVFTNLIVNGLQAMETGGTLTVSTVADLEARVCSVTIADNGAGISKELQEKLFTPFFTTKSHGTGLGLAVSYGIVKDHGGDIRVASEPGQGAKFIVVLPVRQPPGRRVSDD